MTLPSLCQELKCPACGIPFKTHSHTQLKKCKLMCDIALLDKERKVHCPID